MISVAVYVLKVTRVNIYAWLLNLLRRKQKTYFKDKTEEWKELARAPGYENLHSKLSVGDLKSNELFYHNRCWAKLKRDCLANKKKVDDQQSVIILKYNQMYCMRQFTGSF